MKLRKTTSNVLYLAAVLGFLVFFFAPLHDFPSIFLYIAGCYLLGVFASIVAKPLITLKRKISAGLYILSGIMLGIFPLINELSSLMSFVYLFIFVVIGITAFVLSIPKGGQSR